MESMIQIIKKRSSWRSYVAQPVEEDKKKQLQAALAANTQGPFGHQVRFQLLDLTESERDELKKLGTYGVIKGAKLFIVGAVLGTAHAMEDYGYCMEKNILTATGLGLGTCWLGGTFNRSGFSKRIGVAEAEVVPAVTPVGYPQEARSLIDRTFRFVASSKDRKPWDALFGEGDLHTPLTQENAAEYSEPLECVRVAPSAVNRQPWRIVKEKGSKVFHFYLKRTPGYERENQVIKLQDIDLGIALCHFELAARELSLPGVWKETPPALEAGNAEYVISWLG